MYAKLKPNGQIQPAPNVLRIVISNPTPERLEHEGYRRVIETVTPEYDHKTQYLETRYTDNGDTILQVWDVVDIPPEQVAE